MSRFSRPAVIIGVALGVAIPSVAVGYFLRDSAPAVLAPAPSHNSPPVAVNKPMTPRQETTGGNQPMDPIASMSLEEAKALLDRTQALHQAAVRDRRDLFEKMESIRARQQAREQQQ